GFGMGLVVFASSQFFALTLIILAGVGYAWMIVIASCNTALQVRAADEMRGRVMSLFSMMIVGMGPFGSLIAGWIADRIGADWVVGTSGLFCALSGLAFARELPTMRRAAVPMLKERGIVLDPPNG
ncbi:MAG: MFS transporter, partial [Pyrinomonadaceae bacterium]